MDLFVGTEQELQVCQELGAKVCINYKKQDFCKCVKAETGDKGACRAFYFSDPCII